MTFATSAYIRDYAFFAEVHPPELLVRAWQIASTKSQGVRTIVIATKATTITQAVQSVWDFAGIGKDVEVNFNDRANWVGAVSSAVRRERLKEANSKGWGHGLVYPSNEAAKQILETWRPKVWDWQKYNGRREALLNVLAFAIYVGGDGCYDMVKDVFGEDAFDAAHLTLMKCEAERTKLAARFAS